MHKHLVGEHWMRGIGSALLAALVGGWGFPQLAYGQGGAVPEAFSEVRQVTTELAVQLVPRISGDNIVWEDWRFVADPEADNPNTEIYLYNVSTRATLRLTTGNAAQMAPDVGPNHVVWEDWRRVDAIHCEIDIRAYRISDGRNIRVTAETNDAEATSPRISGSTVVWEDDRNSTTTRDDIFWYNFDTGLTGSHVVLDFQNDPTIDGTTIAWDDNRNDRDALGHYLGTNRDLYALTIGGAERPITTAPGNQFTPEISGPAAVWVDRRNYPPTVSGADIYGDPGTGERVLGRAPGETYQSPVISGSLYVYGECDVAAPFACRLWEGDLTTGVRRVVVADDGIGNVGDDASIMQVDLVGNRLVWTWTTFVDVNHTPDNPDDDVTQTNIYYGVLSPLPPPLTITALTATPPAISPNGDGVNDTTTITGSFSKPIASGQLKITSGKTTILNFALPAEATNVSQVWDGKNNAGTVVADGLYRVTLSATAPDGSSASRSLLVPVDRTPPSLSNVSPSVNAFDPWRLQAVTFNGTLSEPSQVTLLIRNAAGAVVYSSGPGYLTTLTGVSWAGNGNPGTNPPFDILPYGLYTYEFQLRDLAGNQGAPVSGTVALTQGGGPLVGGTGVTPSAFNPNLGQTATVSFTTTTYSWVRIFIYNSAGQRIRVFVSGDYPNTLNPSYAWDGKDDLGVIVPPGPYTFKIYVKDPVTGIFAQPNPAIATVTVTAPGSGTQITVSNVSATPAAFDPAAGQTTTINYTLSAPGWVYIKLVNGANGQVLDFPSTRMTTLVNSLVWNGHDAGGKVVPPGRYAYWIYVSDGAGTLASPYPAGGVLTVGTVSPLTVSSVTATPNAFRPILGETTTISYTLSGPAYVNVMVSTPSGVRHLAVNTLQPTAGTYSVVWDGKDLQGALVPAGVYTGYVYAADATNTLAAPYPATVSITVNSASFPPPTFTATPSTLTRGQSTTFTWSAPGATSCTASGSTSTPPWTTSGATSGSLVIIPNWGTGTGLYFLDCQYPAASHQVAQVSITVNPLALTKVSASPHLFQPISGETTAISFTLSAPASTIMVGINNSASHRVRTLTVPAGGSLTKSVIWDGKDDAGAVVPDGLYTYFIWVRDAFNGFASPYPATGTVRVR